MENLNLSIFDIFGFVIPGGVILISGVLIFKIKHQHEIFNYLNSLTATQLLFYVILAYMIGFIADNLSYPLFHYAGNFLRMSEYKSDPEFSLESRARIHFDSPENFQFIERWNALTTFSYNLSFSFLILSVYFFVIGLKRIKYLIMFAMCLVVAGILLNKANMYSEYYEREVKQTIELIQKKESEVIK